MNGYLQDSSGNKSSKRLWGFIILGSAIFLSIFIVIYDVFYNVELTIGIEILKFMFTSGSALLGIGVAENFIIRKKED